VAFDGGRFIAHGTKLAVVSAAAAAAGIAEPFFARASREKDVPFGGGRACTDWNLRDHQSVVLPVALRSGARQVPPNGEQRILKAAKAAVQSGKLFRKVTLRHAQHFIGDVPSAGGRGQRLSILFVEINHLIDGYT
jgi:hypothetical protein